MTTTSMYVGTHEVLPETYVSKIVAMTTQINSCTESYFQSDSGARGSPPSHDQPGRAQEGYTAEEACIAFDEQSSSLWVMLQTGDDGTVDYKQLNPKEKK